MEPHFVWCGGAIDRALDWQSRACSFIPSSSIDMHSLKQLLQPFYDPLSETTQVCRYQKDKPFWILLNQT